MRSQHRAPPSVLEGRWKPNSAGTEWSEINLAEQGGATAAANRSRPRIAGLALGQENHLVMQNLPAVGITLRGCGLLAGGEAFDSTTLSV